MLPVGTLSMLCALLNGLLLAERNARMLLLLVMLNMEPLMRMLVALVVLQLTLVSLTEADLEWKALVERGSRLEVM